MPGGGRHDGNQVPDNSKICLHNNIAEGSEDPPLRKIQPGWSLTSPTRTGNLIGVSPTQCPISMSMFSGKSREWKVLRDSFFKVPPGPYTGKLIAFRQDSLSFVTIWADWQSLGNWYIIRKNERRSSRPCFVNSVGLSLRDFIFSLCN